MTITWTKCSERMPPDDDSYLIIVKSTVGICVSDGRWHNMACKGMYEWTPYDEETWRKLNGRN